MTIEFGNNAPPNQFRIRLRLGSFLGLDMTADAKIYTNERMAAAYAFTRPPVHRHSVERISRYVAQEWPVDAALDIGCGAGASTAALTP